MTYLKPSEFWAGEISSLTELAIILPRQKNENSLLISGDGKSGFATFLDPGEHQYHSFKISQGGFSRNGLVVPGIQIEVDQASVFNPDREFLIGSIVRDKDSLSLLAKIAGFHGFHEEQRVQIETGLSSCGEHLSAGFKKWRIVLGKGEDKRVLWEIDLTPPITPPAAAF